MLMPSCSTFSATPQGDGRMALDFLMNPMNERKETKLENEEKVANEKEGRYGEESIFELS